MPRESGSVQHAGCRLAFDLAGNGPPVLLIQGVGVHGPGWRPQVEALAQHYACLSFDNRGVGRSHAAGGRLSVEGMARDAAAVMDAAGWRSAHLVGHSLGGLIALELALAAPERVRSLALLCTSARGRDLVSLSWWAVSVGLRNRLGPPRWRRRAFLEIVLPPDQLASGDRDALARELEPLFGYDLARQPGIALRQAAATRRYDATARLAALAPVPALVVSGSADRIAPAHCGRALAAALPGSRFVELEGAAHGLTLHRSADVNRLLLEHLGAAGGGP